jgi:homoserine O-succinyltransferase
MNWFGQPRLGPRTGDRSLSIGLVNNMPDAGLAATERQFRGLLSAATERPLRLRLFTCAEIARATPPQDSEGVRYDDLDALFAADLDAVIVTGMEPRAAALSAEPIWPSLIRIADWSAARRMPVLWSCLAAHAAVQHRDGVARQRLPEKLSGLLRSEIAADHPLAADLPTTWTSPHSRHHGLPEPELTAAGYRTVSRSDAGGADIFSRDLDVFLQGHPEYDGHTLLLEYRRDIGRYLTGVRTNFPDAPVNFFDPTRNAALAGIRARAATSRDPALLDAARAVLEGAACVAVWQPTARRFVANWLAAIDATGADELADATSHAEERIA